jgi:hypothetical protein
LDHIFMADDFCAKCKAGSTDESSGGYVDGMFGHQYMGEKDRCSECASYVAVLWKVVLYVPIRAIGCYRYKLVGVSMGSSQFLSRRVPDDAGLIATTRRNGILIAVAMFAAVIAFSKWRRG